MNVASFLALLSLLAAVCADEWPQWRGPQRDGVWREQGIAERFPSGGLPLHSSRGRKTAACRNEC